MSKARCEIFIDAILWVVWARGISARRCPSPSPCPSPRHVRHSADAHAEPNKHCEPRVTVLRDACHQVGVSGRALHGGAALPIGEIVLDAALAPRRLILPIEQFPKPI